MTRSITILLTWTVAAIFVATAHARLDPLSPPGAAAAVIVAIVGAAFVYMRVLTRGSNTSHALGVGIAWLTLSIVAEIIATRVLGHGWFSLLGSPSHPLLRNFFPFVWIFTPVLFARHAEAATQ